VAVGIGTDMLRPLVGVREGVNRFLALLAIFLALRLNEPPDELAGESGSSSRSKLERCAEPNSFFETVDVLGVASDELVAIP
jgi:hypothetical protein